jgi:hypothetical protein
LIEYLALGQNYRLEKGKKKNGGNKYSTPAEIGITTILQPTA